MAGKTEDEYNEIYTKVMTECLEKYDTLPETSTDTTVMTKHRSAVLPYSHKGDGEYMMCFDCSIKDAFLIKRSDIKRAGGTVDRVANFNRHVSSATHARNERNNILKGAVKNWKKVNKSTGGVDGKAEELGSGKSKPRRKVAGAGNDTMLAGVNLTALRTAIANIVQ